MKKNIIITINNSFVNSLNAQFGQARVLEVKGHMSKFIDGVTKKPRNITGVKEALNFSLFKF